MSDDTEALAARLRERMGAAGVGNEELAKAAGVSRQAVSAWRKGRHRPTIENLEAIAPLLGVSVAWIRYGGDLKQVAEDAQRQAQARESHPAEQGRSRGYDEGVRLGVRWAVTQMREALDRISSTGESEGARVVELPWHAFVRPEKIDKPPGGKEKKGA